jgi:hypothetical protein
VVTESPLDEREQWFALAIMIVTGKASARSVCFRRDTKESRYLLTKCWRILGCFCRYMFDVTIWRSMDIIRIVKENTKNY